MTKSEAWIKMTIGFTIACVGVSLVLFSLSFVLKAVH